MPLPRPPFHTLALVLQGGGALGAYQAGVMEGLSEAGIAPDWVAGISIGAINGAIIAGNPPERQIDRLREFWGTISQPGLGAPELPWTRNDLVPDEGPLRQAWNGWNAWRALSEGQRGFFLPRGPAPWLGLGRGAEDASFYDTAPLKSTLERLIDFDRINAGVTRLTVSAVDAVDGNFEVFDNHRGRWRGHFRAEHIMASGALPPGFPAVAIADPPSAHRRGGDTAVPRVRHYWDGGIVSNTPLALVLQDEPRHDTLAFQVDLWSARGALPANVVDVQERVKDIQYSSRTRAITDMLMHEQRQRRLLRDVLAHVPEARRRDDPLLQDAARVACGRCVNVIQLIYQDKAWDGLAKDYEFGPRTMSDHWASGLADIRRTLTHPEWLTRPPGEDPFVTHDVHRLRE